MFYSTPSHARTCRCRFSSRYGGVVPLGAVDPCVNARVLLVGDAAAQVKPTSGGGIVTGLLCARQCARTINEAFMKQEVSPHSLLRYQSRSKRVVGRELAWGMAFRRLYRRVSDDQIDSWFKELQKPAVSEAITRHGDIDYPSRLLLPVLAAAPWLAVKVPRDSSQEAVLAAPGFWRWGDVEVFGVLITAGFRLFSLLSFRGFLSRRAGDVSAPFTNEKDDDDEDDDEDDDKYEGQEEGEDVE